jgi:hypothetical protein
MSEFQIYWSSCCDVSIFSSQVILKLKPVCVPFLSVNNYIGTILLIIAMQCVPADFGSDQQGLTLNDWSLTLVVSYFTSIRVVVAVL